MLGKRKREVVVATRETSQRSSDDERPTAIPSIDGRDVFRKYFESTFEPLPKSQTGTPSLLEDDAISPSLSEDEESEWEGLSESGKEQQTAVEVVELPAATTTEEADDVELQRQQYKTFMVSGIATRTRPAQGANAEG